MVSIEIHWGPAAVHKGVTLIEDIEVVRHDVGQRLVYCQTVNGAQWWIPLGAVDLVRTITA